MALKFLNKKGWHTGSLRNIENVWKAEQKHDAEQKKLDELKKQIQEERERSEFRLLQEQAGLVPRQERLDFLYDSGLAVGKSSSDGFKALEAPPKAEAESSTTKQSLVPGALFVDKPQSANDSWRKLHSDPLLLIKQREQEALRQIKNNPVQMAVIRKSAEAKKKHKEEKGTRKERKKLMQGKHSHRESSDSEEPRSEADDKRKRHPQDGGHLKKLKRDKHSSEGQSDSEGSMRKGEQDRRMRSYHQEDNHLKEEKGRRKEHLKEHYKKSKAEKHSYRESSDSEEHRSEADDRRKRHSQEGGHLIRLKRDKHSSEGQSDSEGSMRKGERDRRMRSYHQEDDHLKEEKGRRKEHSKEHYKKSKQGKHSYKERSDSEEPISEATDRRKRYPQEAGNRLKKLKRVNHSSEGQSDSEGPIGKGQEERGIRGHLQEGDRLKKASHKLHISDSRTDSEGPTGRADNDLRKRGDYHEGDHPRSQALENHHVRPNDLEHRSGSGHRHRPPVQKLSAEEKAARAREMQLDAEVHEEQRWKRLKKASEEDAREAARNAGSSTGRNFLDAAQKSVYGTEKGGSSTIEESVRRRTYYSQGRAGGAHEGNAFRR